MDGGCGVADVSSQNLLVRFFDMSESTVLTFGFPFSRWVDQMGNVHGRYEGLNPREKALLIGSHLVKQPCSSIEYV